MCGKPNPAELEVCQYCEARLKPVTDELSRSQPPIRPGEEPRDVDTSQLESTLPRWLREIRDTAREAAQDGEGQPAMQEGSQQQEKKADLLAGLHSQSESAEEIPDWLSGLRSEGGQVSFEESPTDNGDMDALQSMLGQSSPGSMESEPSGLPSWFTDMDSGKVNQPEDRPSLSSVESGVGEAAQADRQSSLPGQDFRWDADSGTEPGRQPESTGNEKLFDSELPAWLQDTDQPQGDETETGLPAWLGTKESEHTSGEDMPSIAEGELPAWMQDKEEPPPNETEVSLPAWLDTETPTPSPESGVSEATGEGDLPTWLASLGAEDSAAALPLQEPEQPAAKSTTDWLSSFKEENIDAGAPQSAESAIKSTTDWLASLDEEKPEADTQPEPAQVPAEGEMPQWLSTLGEERPEESPPQETEESVAAEDMPDWLAALGEKSDEDLPQEAQPPEEGEEPVWLASLGEQGAEKEEQVLSSADDLAEPTLAASEGEIPDWLSAMGEASAKIEEPAEELDRSGFESGVPPEEPVTTSAFIDDEGKPISKEDVEAIFSMDMPEWLTDVQAKPEVEATPTPAEAQGDELRPADLPSWVQAMRPVESVISETAEVPPEEQPVEERGPLAGLRGVLPAVTGIGPSSKPKGFSIKLQVSEDQQSSAALLEKMLLEEVKPQAAAPQKAVLSQRLLRLIITLVFLSVVALVFFSGTRINPIPTSVPLETSAAWNYIKDSLPTNGAVLMIFDYEAARAGEMEAAAAPLVDQMLTLKGPRLSLVSSTPTGPGLAERFMKLLQTDREYARNEKFINLGYLPGGATGVQAFALDPVTTKQLTTTGENAWSTPVLQGVSQLSTFAAIFLLTDDVETARIWIEQTEAVRGEAQFLVVSSAQSAPMILPYVRSGQVDGIVIGLENSASIEQANSGRPGMAHRYWDAYGFGLVTAALMIAAGSLWNLFSGWQARRKIQGEG
jgi:hypothetical protein